MIESCYVKVFLGLLAGAAVGIVYSRVFRCNTGACPLTSTWWTAGLYGGFVGVLMAATVACSAAPAGAGRTIDRNAGINPAPGQTAVPQEGETKMARHVETLQQFETEVLNAPRPVLVDFYATWCGPCRFLAPVIDQLSQELAGQADVVKVDVDMIPNIAARYRIQGVPTVMLFDGGKPVKSFVGVRQKGEYLNAVREAVGSRS